MDCTGNNKGKEKRRRIGKDSGEGRSNKKVRSRVEVEEIKDVVDAAATATEEEVEEFFAILRRMQVAVKYFEKENGEGWRAALEAEVVNNGCDGDEDNTAAEEEEETQIANKNKRPIVEAAEMTGINLDLNAIPAVETSELW